MFYQLLWLKKLLKKSLSKSNLGTKLLNFYLYKLCSNTEYDDYAQFIASMAQFTQAKICVEIGVAHGNTTKALCKYTKKNGGHVYGFDIWNQHGLVNQFQGIGTKDSVSKMLRRNNLTNFTLIQIDVINNKSDFKAKLDSLLNGQLIDFAFIDADHSYIGIKNDFEVIYPRLSKFGVIAFHDSLMIDGCREFVFDLRTKYFDGTFDLIDLPYGYGKRKVGLSLLVKRSYPIVDRGIEEICGSLSTPDQIEQNEIQWLTSEIEKYKNSEPINKPLTLSDLDPLYKSGNLKLSRSRKFSD